MATKQEQAERELVIKELKEEGILVDNPWADIEDQADENIPTATLQIYKYIDDKIGRSDSTNVNRASAATMCVRRRWYQAQGSKAEALTPRKIVNFALGDLSEKIMLHFIAEGCVGPGKLYSEINFGEQVGSFLIQGDKKIIEYSQPDLSFMIGDLKITGHVDGLGKRNSDGQWELIECKSSSDYGFMKFQNEGAGDYLKQAHALMMTDELVKLEVNAVRFFYLKKQTGHLWDRVHDFDEHIAEEVCTEFEQAASDKVPDAPHKIIEELFRRKPTGRFTVPWQCGYCPYLETCKGKHKKDWKSTQWGTKKPVYLFDKLEGDK